MVLNFTNLSITILNGLFTILIKRNTKFYKDR